MRPMTVVGGIDRAELDRYVRRVGDRWPLERAYLGGARVDDLAGVGPQRERGEEYVVVLVSDRFDGVPWLERVHTAANLWDAGEMGARADVHCYTAAEVERKRESLPRVRRTVDEGLDLIARPAGRVDP